MTCSELLGQNSFVLAVLLFVQCAHSLGLLLLGEALATET